eukprot:TCALIF_06058-PA protein Name:"Protein of unknown function" AED:0.09 eAED:0.09 QI:0/0/0.5/0.5/1/1/2/10/219
MKNGMGRMSGPKKPLESITKPTTQTATSSGKPALNSAQSKLTPKPSKAKKAPKSENQPGGEKRKRDSVTKISRALSSSQPNLSHGLGANQRDHRKSSNASATSSGRTSANSTHKKKPRTKTNGKRAQPSTKKTDLISGKEHPDLKPKRTFGPDNRSPIFSLDIKTQNTRLVTTRQRQEIYALNRLMTTLENERFKTMVLEKAPRSDTKRPTGPLDDVFL